MSATIKDVAREAGVASGTISKYLNGGSVRPENKKNIEEAENKVSGGKGVNFSKHADMRRKKRDKTLTDEQL